MFKILSLFKSSIRCNYIKAKDIQNKSIINNKHSNSIFKFNRCCNKASSTHCYSYNTMSNTSGFSLLELSLVLIIMGILIIGIIKGYALMTASRIITLTNELTQYAFAAEQFSAKYGNLPGIIDNPQKIFGSAAKSKIDDDKMDRNAINETASITNAESINFFNHLYLSGLLGEGSTPFVGTNEDLSSKNEITKDSNYYPKLKSLKSMFIYVRGDDIDGAYNKLNRLTVSNYSKSMLGINADLIFGLDNKVDDGLPLSGLISIIPMRISNYDSGDKSSNYNDKNNDTQVVSISNIIDYHLLSLNTINTFNIINIANAKNSSDSGVSSNSGVKNRSVSESESRVSAAISASSSSVSSSTSCLVLDKSTNEIKYNTKGKNCFILRNIDSTQQNKITDLAIKGTVGESCNLSSVDDYLNAESVAGSTMLNGSNKTIKCDNGYDGHITLTCNEGHVIHTGDTKCTFNGCKKYDNSTINSSLNTILTTNDMVDWDNIEETEKTILLTDDNKSYSKNDVIATLSCKKKVAYDLEDGSNGYIIKCNGNDNMVVDNNGGCEYKIKTCSVKDLTSDILGNDYVKTVAWCDNLDCSILKNDSVVDIRLSENKEKTYDFGTILTINTCNTGYSAPESKRMIRCGESGEWEIYRGTTNNMCTFTGCNDMSAVFDINDKKVSDQLYKMTFAYSGDTNSVYPVLACNNMSSVDGGTDLSTSKKFVVDISTEVTCGGDIYNAIHGDLQNRKFICTEDTTNINKGDSYWKYDFVSCDLNEIKGKDYTVWLAKNSIQDLSTISTSNATTLDTNTFQKRYVANKWGDNYGIATSKYNDFTLKCNSHGNWVMEKTNNSCSGIPVLTTASKFYSSDTNIQYVGGQTGMLMNKNTLARDTSILTTTMLSTAETYFVTNGTKIKADCNSGYQEVDKNNLVNGSSGYDIGGHYYECVDGTWAARGGCQIKTCSIANLTTEILGNDYVKTVAQCNDLDCSFLKSDSAVDIRLSENKEKTYDFETILTINTCGTGYSAPESKRMIRCNEDGEWEIYNNTEDNMCTFTGCNDMSAVFDINNNKVSSQLYKMTFGSDNSADKVYPILYCNNITEDSGNTKKLNNSGNFVASYNSTAVCADNENQARIDTTNKNRQYVCTKDTNNINNGNSYWKYYITSCDLNQIADKGYTLYLSSGVLGSNISIENNSIQYRYLRSTNWSRIYTDRTEDFTLTCGAGGSWVMEKASNSCSGVPTLKTASKFYKSDTNIQYVGGQTGKLMNKNTLTQDTSTLTKTMLSTTETYFVTNGTKIEASCNSGYQEIDKNGLINSSSESDAGGHYYECVNGTWTARGECAIKVDYYSPRYYNDVGKTGTIATSKYFKIGEEVKCSSETFGSSDPDNGTLKICAINGYRVAADGDDAFVVKDYSAYTSHAFCHKSYIPRDLGAGWSSGTGDGNSVGVDGWCSEGINKNTYRGVGAKINNGSSFNVEHSVTGVSASGTLTCDNGTWKNDGGSMNFGYTGSIATFCVPNGLKTAKKSITFEIRGGSTSERATKDRNFEKGGYTKGVMSYDKYSDKQTFYVVVGQVSQTGYSVSAYNGGGKTGNTTTSGEYYSGGGATHIATVSGLLSSLESNKSAVLLVAGGAGGNTSGNSAHFNQPGAGGGNNNNGGDGEFHGDSGVGGKGGTQSAGGSGAGSSDSAGSFGQGGNCNGRACWGGGGGYYGGGTSGAGAGGGGGGSGYCNTSKFTCSGSNGENKGNGKAKISW